MLKYLRFCIILVFAIFLYNFNIIDVNASCVKSKVYRSGDKKINLSLDITKTGNNNTNPNNIIDKSGTNGGGVFFDANNSSFSSEQLELNSNGEGVLVFQASALTGHYISGLYVQVTINGEKIETKQEFDSFWCKEAGENEGSVDFKLTAKGEGLDPDDDVVIILKATTVINNICKKVVDSKIISGISSFGSFIPVGGAWATLGVDQILNLCQESRDFSVNINLKAFEEAASGKTEEEQQNAVSNNVSVNTTTTAAYNVNDAFIPDKTEINVFEVNPSQKIECDDGESSLRDFISDKWKYFIIFTPILLIFMVTMDFFKALFSSDSDFLKKAGSNTVKRTVAAIILLLLPLIIETILGFFGLELCI